MAAKPCSKCKIEKSLSNFSRRSNRKEGYSSQCKDCKRQYNKNYYKVSGVKEKLIENHRKYRKNLKTKEKEQNYRRIYEKNRLDNDVLFKLRKNLRSRISHLVKRKRISKKKQCHFMVRLLFFRIKKSYRSAI